MSRTPTLTERWVTTLTDDERDWLRDLAERRQRIKEEYRVRSRKHDGNEGRTAEVDRHYEGLCGEYVAARHLRVTIDTSVSPKGNQRGWDLLLPNGATVEVMTRRRRGWAYALKGEDLSAFKADIGVLVWPGLMMEPYGTYEVVGWTTREHFATRAQVEDFKYGGRLTIRHGYMGRPATLAEYLIASEKAQRANGLEWTGRSWLNG